MIIHHQLDSFPKLNYPVVTSGTFDGVHLGHQKIIEQLNREAKLRNGESVLVTFHPHPRQILFPDDSTLRFITPFEDKVEILETLAIDHLVKIKFTREFAQKSSLDFIHQVLLDAIGTKMLIIGYDHRFGKNREGSFEYLKQYAPEFGFDLREISRQDVENVGISSTKIRKSLQEGDVKKANRYLGRMYHLKGKVVSGNQLGRQLGFPTANLEPLEKLQIVPADGIYAVYIQYKELFYEGMLSIGLRPTIGTSARTIEVNIFDFNQEIYGEELTVYFVERYRDEKKFATLELLQEQLKKDWIKARELLSCTPLKTI